MELDSLSKDKVVQSALNFIATLTEVYGTSEGFAVWEKISESVTEDVKGEILFGMLTGHSAREIRISARHPPPF